MNLDLQYRGRSGVRDGTVRLAPNLARPLVAFDGGLRDPLLFREGMAALYAAVTGDARRRVEQNPEQTAAKREVYREFLRLRGGEEEAARRGGQQAAQAAQAQAQAQAQADTPADLDAQFSAAHRRYWAARRGWAAELSSGDPAMFRALVPCDPIVTVAADAVFFEGFSKDLSAAGCLRVDRDRFTGAQSASPGTTNVDYSAALHDQLEGLRSYRPGGLRIDPEGVELRREEATVREERIALPDGWLAGLGQLAASAQLPAALIRLAPAAVARILAWLQRHRERAGPRAIRAELTPGAAPVLVLEPWGLCVEAEGVWGGERRTIRVWGRRRLAALARVLPVAEHVEVRLLGSGLPSWWIAKLPGMRFSLGLSGWSANAWSAGKNTGDGSAGAALDLLAGLEPPDRRVLEQVAAALARERALTLDALIARAGGQERPVQAALWQLAKGGLVLSDEADRLYRWRPILPPDLGHIVDEPHPERVGAQEILQSGALRIVRQERLGALHVRVGTLDGVKTFELGVDPDGVIRQGRCDCSWFHRGGIRRGPCRHLLALRLLHPALDG